MIVTSPSLLLFPLVTVFLHCLRVGLFSFLDGCLIHSGKFSVITSFKYWFCPMTFLFSWVPSETCFSVSPPWFLTGLTNYSSYLVLSDETCYFLMVYLLVHLFSSTCWVFNYNYWAAYSKSRSCKWFLSEIC